MKDISRQMLVDLEMIMERDPMWNNLQEPYRPSRFPPGYMLLLAAVDTGWNISGPVLMQAALQDSDPCSYAFLLTNNNSATLRELVVPECHDIEVFIRSEGLTVVGNCYA
jgi:hypothetical protein